MKCEIHIRKYEDYLIANSKSKETVESYIRTIKQFLKLCNNPDDINKDDINRYKLYAVKKYNSNSLTPRYASINLYLKYIGKSKDWRDEYKLKPPKQYTPNKIPLTEDEIKGLFRQGVALARCKIKTWNDMKEDKTSDMLLSNLLKFS